MHWTRNLCRALKVAESSFHHWRARRGQPDGRIRANEADVRRAVKKLHRQGRGSYGRPRLLARLREEGYAIGGNRLRRIMLEMGLSGRSGRKGRKRETVEQTKTPPAPNLLKREFVVDSPNKVWTGDITEFRVGHAKLYLAVVIDLFSRTIVGWMIADHRRCVLVIDAMKNAVRRRKPAAHLIFHSDQGAQYKATRFIVMLRTLGIEQSMSRRGNCWDNAPTESFFATLKKELVYTRSWASRAELELAITKYIAYYNRRRLHTTLGLKSPRDYEHDHAA
jgi:transposase InsO family protein